MGDGQKTLKITAYNLSAQSLELDSTPKTMAYKDWGNTLQQYDKGSDASLHILAFDFYYFSDDTRNLRFAKTYYSKQRISDYV
ncbi:MAG: hypothetical protein AB1349_14360 [Elusimicrobiota bacterium]